MTIAMRTLHKTLDLVALLIFFVVSATTGALAQERRLAFVIGNGAYKTGELATAANDAGLIAQTLQAAGFDVVGARCGSGLAARCVPRFHGQGVTSFSSISLARECSSRARISGDTAVGSTRSLSGLPTKVNLVVLDAARSKLLRLKEPLASGPVLVDPDPNMLIAFNAAPGTVASEGNGPYGAQALAEMIRDSGLLQDVFDRTRLRVSEVTEGVELPWSVSKVIAPFSFFNRGPKAPPSKVSAAERRAI